MAGIAGVYQNGMAMAMVARCVVNYICRSGRTEYLSPFHRLPLPAFATFLMVPARCLPMTTSVSTPALDSVNLLVNFRHFAQAFAPANKQRPVFRPASSWIPGSSGGSRWFKSG